MPNFRASRNYQPSGNGWNGQGVSGDWDVTAGGKRFLMPAIIVVLNWQAALKY